ncbi:MAG TPA: extracellular solute-binding protein [Solirubrobacteraceae bacterium]|jgi:iron(III) transport system substrate-binding protein|nr:extracellular solute-binding protein [Solirubrobacteraceae bacterium]
MRARPLRSVAIALASVATVFAVAACGSSNNSTSSSATPAAATSAAGSKPTLLVYSAQGYSPNGVEAFTKETGIPAKLVEDSTGPLLARIQAEKANPQWGLLWVDGNEAFAELDNQGMLRKGLTVPALTSTGESLLPADHSFVPTGLTTACTMIYNSKAVSSPPTTWQQLLESRWAGKIGMNNPAVSGPTFPCVAGLMNYLGGVSQGETFVKKLKSAGLHVSEANSNTLHLLETGQIDIGLIQSSAAIGAAAKVPGLKVAYLPKMTLLPSVIGVDSKTPPAVQQEAQQFVTWVLSPAGQHQMQIGDPHGDSLYWPVVPGLKPLALLPELSTLSTQTIDPYVWGAREATINNWFNANIAQ